MNIDENPPPSGLRRRGRVVAQSPADGASRARGTLRPQQEAQHRAPESRQVRSLGPKAFEPVVASETFLLKSCVCVEGDIYSVPF